MFAVVNKMKTAAAEKIMKGDFSSANAFLNVGEKLETNRQVVIERGQKHLDSIKKK